MNLKHLLIPAADLLLFAALYYLGVLPSSAHVVSFFMAAALLWVRRNEVPLPGFLPPVSWSRTAMLALVALVLRGGVVGTGLELLHLPFPVAATAAVAATALTIFFGARLFCSARLDEEHLGEVQRYALFLLGTTFLIRLLFIGLPELLPEEAYYWQYARHLDIGYLDHPPFVGWTIALGTALFGNNEFGVRIPGLLCSAVSAFFFILLARRLYGRSQALFAAALAFCVPYFFMNGFYMSPDAGLMACCTAAAYFIIRAVIDGSPSAWVGIAAAFGIGLFSKYTIVLLGAATFIFICLSKEHRFWLRRPEPYLAGVGAFLIFSPVVYWNVIHDWASFAFQSERRLNSSIDFSLHAYLLNCLVLVTPFILLLTFGLWMTRRGAALAIPSGTRTMTDAELRLVQLLAAVPFLLFAVYSMRHSPKLNWAAPSFVAVVPLIPLLLSPAAAERTKLFSYAKKLCEPSVYISLALMLAVVHYSALGFPGIGYRFISKRFIGWRDLAAKVLVIAEKAAHQDGEPPIVTGMDKHLVASQLAFYTANAPGAPQVYGRTPFKLESLMYSWWTPAEAFEGRTVIMVADKPDRLSDDRVIRFFNSISEITPLTVEPRGSKGGTFYYRIGRKFHSPAPAAGEPAGDTGVDDAE